MEAGAHLTLVSALTVKGLRGQPRTRPKTCPLSHGEMPPGHPHLPTSPVHRGGFLLTVNGDRDVEKEMIPLFLLPCILRFLSMGSCSGDPSTPGLTPLRCRWDPGRCDLRPTGEEGLHLWPDAAAGGPNGEPGPRHTPALSGSRASGSSHPPRQQTLSRPARTQSHSWLVVSGYWLWPPNPSACPMGLPSPLPQTPAMPPARCWATCSFIPGSLWGAPSLPLSPPPRAPARPLGSPTSPGSADPAQRPAGFCFSCIWWHMILDRWPSLSGPVSSSEK